MKRIVVHHHLGLGDHLICNGLVNHLAETWDVVYLACKRAYYPTIACLYSEQPAVNIFTVQDERQDVDRFARDVGAEVLRIGFDRCDRSRFDESFYEQLGIPFEYRYTKFRLPARIPGEDALFSTLNPGSRFIVIHREWSHGLFVLRVGSALPAVDIRRRSGDVFTNLLAYRRVIQEAAEIHCINSSVIHLVDSLETGGRLFYHDVRDRDFQLRRQWATVEYGARPMRVLLARVRRAFE